MTQVPPGTRPLYDAAATLTSCPAEGHRGLWYDKFCHLWRHDRGTWSLATAAGDDGNPKKRWIDTLAEADRIADDKAKRRRQEMLDAYARRLGRLALARNGTIAEFRATSRFVTGLGRSHPVENGFAWHPTLGTPYLPGSSLKGVAHAQAREMRPDGPGNEATPEQKNYDECVARVFGDAGRVGTVTFLDSVPVEAVTLEADVMTPHYAGWSEEQLPGDWRAPTPIPFLTAAEGTTLLVGLVPRHSGADGDLSQAWEWVSHALTEEGAGAKTAVGYGRFAQVGDGQSRIAAKLESEKRQQELARERATPEGRARQFVAGATEEKVAARVKAWFVQEHPPECDGEPVADPQAECLAFAQEIRRQGFVAKWLGRQSRDPGTPTSGKKLRTYGLAVSTLLGQHEDG